MKRFETELTPSFQSVDASLTAPRSAGALPGPWARAAFQGSEDFFPDSGKNPVFPSRGWEKCFQALEEFRSGFPRPGKIQRLFFRRWKFCNQFFRALEKMESVFPDVGRIPSKGWNFFSVVFPDIGKFGTGFSKGWKAAAKRGCAGACACVGLRFLPGVFR